MVGVPYTLMRERFSFLADHSRSDRVTREGDDIVIKTPGLTYQSITFCSKCGGEFGPADPVYHDEVNNYIYCEKCAGEIRGKRK